MVSLILKPGTLKGKPFAARGGLRPKSHRMQRSEWRPFFSRLVAGLGEIC
jgi:hypothetical protein